MDGDPTGRRLDAAGIEQENRVMAPCTGTFGAFTAPKPVKVQATTTDDEAVYSLTVVVQPRGEDVVFEHFTHSRTELENGTVTWNLEPSRIYTLALMTDRALTLQTTIDVGTRQIVSSSCSNSGPGVAGLWTIPTRKVAS
jgi:hypothetical protein